MPTLEEPLVKAEEQIKEDWEAYLKELVEEIRVFARSSLWDKEQIRNKLRKFGYNDQQIELGFSTYKEAYAHENSLGGAVLRSERSKDRLNWYNPPSVPEASSRWGKLRTVLKSRDWSDEHIDDLDHQSNSVVSNLGSPKGDPGVTKGLALGYVQSGKTANFSATIAKATDEGYGLVIVLSGMYNNLRSQTETRLRSELTDPHKGAKSFTLTTSDTDGDFVVPTFSPNSVLGSENKFVLAVLKKNNNPLTKLRTWLSQASPEVLAKCPTLIIDDEADQASVNESRKRDEQTAINKHIRELVDYLGKQAVVSYVGYTATPFANILIDAQQESDLFPRDFIIALKAPDSYVGAERLFGRAPLYGDEGEPGLDLVRNITIDSGDVINNDEDKLPSALTQSMIRAINSFLLAGAERIRRGDINKHITMLFNTSQFKAAHEEMFRKIDAYITKARVLIEESDPTILNSLKVLWESDLVKTTETNFDRMEMGDWHDIVECLKVFIQKENFRIIKENSESESRLNFSEGRVWAIIVGGSTLSRGLTIEGLTVSYFHRTTSGYDTLLQMGRWFGYRSGYLDLTRVFVTAEMEANFYHLATVEQELREDIIRMENNGERPIDIALKIRDHDRLDVTKKQVLKHNSHFASNSYSGCKIQATHIYLDDRKRAEHNLKAIQSLVTNLEDSRLRVENSFKEYRRCLLYKNVGSASVLEFLSKYSFSPADKKFSFGLLHPYIAELNKQGELTKWSVAVMSIRTADEDKCVDLGVKDLKVYAHERRQSQSLSTDLKADGAVLGNVTIMKDEVIDMGDLATTDDAEKFIKQFGKDTTAVAVRNKRPADRGLLLIYPIHTNSRLTKEERENLIEGHKLYPVISDIEKLFAVTLVFPPTRQDKFEFNYIANATLPKR